MSLPNLTKVPVLFLPFPFFFLPPPLIQLYIDTVCTYGNDSGAKMYRWTPDQNITNCDFCPNAYEIVVDIKLLLKIVSLVLNVFGFFCELSVVLIPIGRLIFVVNTCLALVISTSQDPADKTKVLLGVANTLSPIPWIFPIISTLMQLFDVGGSVLKILLRGATVAVDPKNDIVGNLETVTKEMGIVVAKLGDIVARSILQVKKYSTVKRSDPKALLAKAAAAQREKKKRNKRQWKTNS